MFFLYIVQILLTDTLLEKFVFISQMKVEWGDMDAFGHVNNIEYFRYFQISRIDYWNNMKSNFNIKTNNLSTILAATDAKYVYPLKYPDTIFVGVRVDSIAKQYLNMKYCIVSNNNKKVATVGSSKIFMFDYDKNKKANIPDDIKNNIIEFEKTAIKIIE